MGELFKAMAIAAPKFGALPGFETAVMKIEAPTLALDRHPPRFLHARGRRFRRPLCQPQRRRRLARRRRPCRGKPRAHGGGARRRAAPFSHRLSNPFAACRRRRGAWPAETRPRADAIVTRMRALAIGVTTADCGPILLADPQARVIGAAHAGWRGALTGVVEATVAAMERLGAERGQIRAAIGPMIRQANYEVGPDLIARFAAEDPRQRPLLPPGRARRPCPVRSWRLYRRAAGAGRHRHDRGSRPVHLCRSGAIFQLRRTTHRARGRLRPARECDRIGEYATPPQRNAPGDSAAKPGIDPIPHARKSCGDKALIYVASPVGGLFQGVMFLAGPRQESGNGGQQRSDQARRRQFQPGACRRPSAAISARR